MASEESSSALARKPVPNRDRPRVHDKTSTAGQNSGRLLSATTTTTTASSPTTPTQTLPSHPTTSPIQTSAGHGHGHAVFSLPSPTRRIASIDCEHGFLHRRRTHRRHLSNEHELAATGTMKLRKIKKPPPSPPPPSPQPTQQSSRSEGRSIFATATFDFDFKRSRSKAAKEDRRRSNSLQEGDSKSGQARLTPRHGSPSLESRGRSASARPPCKSQALRPVSFMSSGPYCNLSPRPTSSNSSLSPNPEAERTGRVRSNWLPVLRSRSNSISQVKEMHGLGVAWTLGPSKAEYSTVFLVSGEKVPELWNEGGDVLVYLHPRDTSMGPSFKVPSFAVDNSMAFLDLIDSETISSSSSGASCRRDSYGQDSADPALLSPPISPPASAAGHRQVKLYLPVATGATPVGEDSELELERMISIRNMFAFLTGQPLVATRAQPTLFSVMLQLSNNLAEFQFGMADGSTFGDAVDMSFDFLIDTFSLADLRHSTEKTLESLILGERMKSWALYNEAFSHAVGKYSAIRNLQSPMWDLLSTHTRLKLERSHLELLSRQGTVNKRLESFDIPALFSGVANSATSYKKVKFGTWKKSFHRMRSFVLAYYKGSFGSWPPKARSKKNHFSVGGLNRQALKMLYSDLCSLYDLLVDRDSLTPRGVDQAEEVVEDESPEAALRRILTEFETSSPPVLPPIPFDIPMLPTMTSVKENFHALPPKEQLRLEKELPEHELRLILNKSYDFDTSKLKNAFLQEFMEFEFREAKGKTTGEVADQRFGYWLFLYVIIQLLPMLVVDAPDLNFTDGVEYFLCQPPKGHPPWMVDAPEVRKRWYEIAGGAGFVQLSADTVEFSIEAIYHRSHCWAVAKAWEAGYPAPTPPLQDFVMSPLQPPLSIFTDMDPSRGPGSPGGRAESPGSSGLPSPGLRAKTSSPGGRHHPGSRSSIMLGLEPVGDDEMNRRGTRSFSARGGSITPRPGSSVFGDGRSVSSGAVMRTVSPESMAGTDYRASLRMQELQGSTFEDILKDIPAPNIIKKKKSKFFG